MPRISPRISVVMPAFNRADTIMRAINSVLAQTCQDWELIVVDDGSTDNTAKLVVGIDARIQIIRQENRGMTEARNTAIRASTGEYLAFLDSDDEFLPHHLELCLAFLETFKEEQFVSTELLEDFGHGRVVNHYRIETSEWYPRKAALIGSHCFDLPAGETDNYLRAYERREPIGDWGRHIVQRVAPNQDVFLYRGNIFQHMRFDYMIAITASVIRRSVFDTLGLPEARWATGSDFHFLARMCKKYRANYISLPTFVKHEFGVDGALPVVGHVVTGKSALAFAKDWQNAWDDLFWHGVIHDNEQRALRGLRQYWVAKVALEAGQRDLTLHCLKDAREGIPRFWSAIALHWLVQCLPGTALARKALRFYNLTVHRCTQMLRILSGEVSPQLLLRKIVGPERNPRHVAGMGNTPDGV